MVMVVEDLIMAHSKTRSHYHCHYCFGGSVAVAPVGGAVVVPVGGAVVVAPVGTVGDAVVRVVHRTLSLTCACAEFGAPSLWTCYQLY